MRPLTAVHLPAIRDTLATNIARRRRVVRALLDGTPPDEAPAHWEMAEQRILWDDGSAMRSAELWWVTPDMTTLAAHSAREWAPLPHWDLQASPHRSGLMVFDGGLPERIEWTPTPDDPSGPIPVRIDAMSWHIRDAELHLGIWTADPAVRAMNVPLWRSDPVPLVQIAVDGQYPHLDELLLRVLAATMLISSEPTIAQTRPASWALDTSGKSARRQKEVPAVKVIALREILHSRHDDADGVTREYTHRWIVDGHQRTYWTGPGRTTKLVKTLLPYVAGPAHLPLVVKESVRIWRR